MKYLNEISRMQQLAGIIKEIKIDSPILLNAKIGDVKRDDNDGDYVDIDFYLGSKKIASGGGFIIHSNEFENVTVDPEIYPDFRNILNKYNIPNDNEWGLIHIPYLNDTIMRIDNSNVAGYVNDGLQEIKINNPTFNEDEVKEYLNNLAWGFFEGCHYDGGGSFTFEKQEEGDDEVMGEGAEKNFNNAVRFLKQVGNYQPNYYGSILGSMFLDDRNDIVFEF